MSRPAVQSKYRAQRTGKYASKKEAKIAGDLAILAKAGKIRLLQEQVEFILIKGRDGVRGISYIADFTWVDEDGVTHIGDAKGFKTPVYILKKKMMFLLRGLVIEEL